MTEFANDKRLRSASNAEEIFEPYHGNPIGDLILSHNCGREYPAAAGPTLFIATCIDSRVRLQIRSGAAFELRAAGVRVADEAEFQIAFAISLARVRHVAVISHEDCAMTHLAARGDDFASGIEEHSEWTAGEAQTYFAGQTGSWQKDDPVGDALETVARLRKRFPAIHIAPLHYSVTDGKLWQISEQA